MQTKKEMFTEEEWNKVQEMIKDPFLFSLPEKKKVQNQKPMKKVRTKRNRRKKK